jgi:hypothetical protein
LLHSSSKVFLLGGAGEGCGNTLDALCSPIGKTLNSTHISVEENATILFLPYAKISNIRKFAPFIQNDLRHPVAQFN